MEGTEAPESLNPIQRGRGHFKWGKGRRQKGDESRDNFRDYPEKRDRDRPPRGRERRRGKTAIKFENDGHDDPELRPMKDDPRTGSTIYRNEGGRNSESFDPSSTFVRPAMRVIVGPKAKRYNKTLKHDDVVVVPDFFCQQDDWSIYYQLVEEMRKLQAEGQRGSEWISWHEGCHLISKNPKNC